MNILTIIMATILFLSIENNAMAGIFGPSNPEECVQKYMPKTKSDIAAKMISSACRKLYSDNKSEKKKAKCVLNLSNLYKAQNDSAAKAIYHSSKCSRKN